MHSTSGDGRRVPSLMRWRIREGAEFLWRTWDSEEILVYDTFTGDTHLVNRVTSEALRSLQLSPCDPAELSQRIAESLGVENEPVFDASVRDLLAHLDRIGLVEPAS